MGLSWKNEQILVFFTAFPEFNCKDPGKNVVFFHGVRDVRGQIWSTWFFCSGELIRNFRRCFAAALCPHKGGAGLGLRLSGCLWRWDLICWMFLGVYFGDYRGWFVAFGSKCCLVVMILEIPLCVISGWLYCDVFFYMVSKSFMEMSWAHSAA